MNISKFYSTTYTPFGGAQKTWTNTYDPKLKYSGKEREGYTNFDYFGARYYDHNSYRFISVDPIINKSEALTNPQLWNLYAYCRNNPITYLDPDGRRLVYQNSRIKRYGEMARQYLRKSRLATSIINKLDSSNLPDIKVVETSGATEYAGFEKTLYWNPFEGNWIGPGQIQSPSINFFHECAHALRNLIDPSSQLIDKRIEMDDYGDWEEYRVISLETRVARQINRRLKKGPWEATRTKHNVPGVKVKDPTSKEEMK